jgi:6-phosphofructokinase 1
VNALCKEVEAKTGVETRGCVPGHIQRGGSPSARDRILASDLGYYAVQLLREGQSCRVVGIKDNRIVNYDITEALAMKKDFDYKLLKMAREISI